MELELDVTDAAGLGERATIALTVHLPRPERLASPPVVCFAKAGAGFTRRYYTLDLPGPASGAQADWHTERGWVFVSVDHLGVGDSSQHDGARLDFTALPAAALAAEQQVLDRLLDGTLDANFPAVVEPTVIGIGQSMGGATTIVQQGRYHCYDGIAVLGFSAVHTHPPTPSGGPLVAQWRSRDANQIVLNERVYEESTRQLGSPEGLASISWQFYYEDVLPYLPDGGFGSPGARPPWISATIPRGVIECVLTPGVVAGEAAAVDTPVLIAAGERDVIADPRSEARSYISAPSVDLFVCPRMAHMHNFAGTRTLFWSRIARWASWVSELQAHNPSATPRRMSASSFGRQKNGE